MATETAVDVVMPQMGVSVSEGTITRWLKQEGEQVEADEPLLEISTDKVDTEVPSPASGTVTQILVQEGETVDVGTKLGQIGGAAGGAEPAPAAEPETPAPVAEAPPEQEAPPRPSRLRLLPLRRHRPATGRRSCPPSSPGSRASTGSIRRRCPAPAAVGA